LLTALLAACGGSETPTLSVTAASAPAGTTGQAYPGYAFMASGGAPPLSWTASSSLPAGLTLSTTGQLSGTPATGGTYTFSVTVTDASAPPQTASAAVNIKINDSVILIARASPPPGTVTYPYSSFAFSASGGSPPYAWTSSGALPPGLTLGNDGTVSGTPTQTGSFPFSVTARDSAQTPTNSAPLATAIVVNIPPPLTLNAAPAPPAGVDSTLYGPFSFSANGGYLPLHWSITAGSLPPGLALGSDGSLSGTPTSVDLSHFTVTVTDSASVPAMSSLPFSINIAPPPPPVISYAEPPTGTVGSGYAPFQFTVKGGLAPLIWSESPLLSNGLSLSPDGLLSGTPTAAGQFPINLEAIDALNQKAPSVAIVVRVSLPHPAAFSLLPEHLNTPRSSHTATLLNTGKVLIAGGGNGVADISAELYDPATGTFTAITASMTEPRVGHTATLLNDPALPNYGKVLILGSTGESAELYDPADSMFAATGSMHHARTSPTATLLSNNGPNAGKVLVVGGNSIAGDLVAELYDPSTGAFTDTGSTTILRAGHTATLLTAGPLTGQVLIAGGSGSKSAELYNPATGSFTRTGDMSEPRSGHTATALGTQDGTQNGDVLIVGTNGATDLYDPTAGAFTAVGSYYPNYSLGIASRTASLRRDGTVLVAGGYVLDGVYKLEYGPPPQTYCVLVGYLPASISWAELFAPESDGFTATAPLGTSRDGHTATMLPDGSVLIAGGIHHALVSSPPSSNGTALTSGATRRTALSDVSPDYSHPCFTSTESATVLSSAELFK
jgi:hypothetical protein